ncbi:MAG: hypothetical protein JST89_15100 [Cyanobacteria bacterium SZAS-4]|nr:hypothetical protein [Cyanobacteria bacterium SZAS-4]
MIDRTSDGLRIAVLAAMMLLEALSAGCSNRSPQPQEHIQSPQAPGLVLVEQEPISVKKEFFDRGSTQSKQVAEEHNQSANTHWKFQCVPKFRFHIVKMTEANPRPGDHVVTVKLRITSVSVFLAAPVTIYLPKLAKPEVVSHEDGHFKICKKVYDRDARPAAQSAAQALIGKEFEGSGNSLELASQEALHHAAQEMGRGFRSKTIDYLDRVSAYYDQLTPQHPESKYVDVCVEAAFKAEEQMQAKNKIKS